MKPKEVTEKEDSRKIRDRWRPIFPEGSILQLCNITMNNGHTFFSPVEGNPNETDAAVV